MDDLSTLRAVLGWCTLLNFGLLVFVALMLRLVGRSIRQLHARLFGLHEEQLPLVYFQWMAHYKTFVLFFNLMPYLALRLVA